MHVFVNNCLSYLLSIWWPNKISNADLWRQMEEQVQNEIYIQEVGLDWPNT